MEKEQKIIKKIEKRGPSPMKDFLYSEEEIPRFSDNKFINDFRENAYKVFKSMQMPTIKDEAWRRTNIKDLHPERFNMLHGKEEDIVEISTITSGRDKRDKKLYTLILKPNGEKQVQSSIELPKGLVFKALRDAEVENSDLISKIMGKIVKPKEGKFAALSSAFANNGILLYVPENMQVELTLNSVFWGSGDETAFFNHIMIYLENNSSVSYIHEEQSSSKFTLDSIHGGIVEGYVGKNAKLKFVEIQSFGRNFWNFGHERIQVDQDGEVNWVVGSLGSKLTKSFYDLDLIGVGSLGKMSGFYFLDGEQHIDHDTQQNHFCPNTSSDLLFKGALVEKGHSVWQGMIYVAQEAQKTDGYQANRNLLLSKDARADSIPGLEILADDVRCTHGATMGAIDPDQIFYLKSRGIEEKAAKVLIIEGFFEQILSRIPNDTIRDYLIKSIDEKMTF